MLGITAVTVMSNRHARSRVISQCPLAVGVALFDVWMSSAGGDQVPQACVDVVAPRVRALAEALELGNQTNVGEANLGEVALR